MQAERGICMSVGLGWVRAAGTELLAFALPFAVVSRLRVPCLRGRPSSHFRS